VWGPNWDQLQLVSRFLASNEPTCSVFSVRIHGLFGESVSTLVRKCGFRAEFPDVTMYFAPGAPSESIFVGSLVIAIPPTEGDGKSIFINLLHNASCDLGSLQSATGIYSDFGCTYGPSCN